MSRFPRLTRIGSTLAAATLAAIPLALISTSANAAEPHQDNPYVGATQFVNPSWRSEVLSQAASTSDSTLAAKMQAISSTSTAVWMDRRAAVTGADGGLGLAGYLDAALAQKGSGAETIEIVIYDLPGRDCNALASNGELPATDAGLATYKTEYIDPIAATMADSKYAGLRIVTIIEPDSLPNIVTNTSVSACVTAGPYYEAGVAYALDKLHAISNVYTYLDMGHAGWLGWPNNASGAATEFKKVADMTAAGTASVDGFISDTANTTPLNEPFFTGDTQVGGQPVKSADFYEWNPDVDEASFTADMYTRLTAAGFPSSIGMLIDTSRNGWGGAARPTAVSTSTDLNTFVDESKVDLRPHRGAWCNQDGAGIGERPTASPAGYSASHLDAFVWVKPPGESDGASTDIPNDQGKKFDRMCDPTYVAPNLGNQLTNALPNAPLSGEWFPEQFTQLVQNAYPVIGGGGGGDTTAPSQPSGVTVSGSTSSSVSLSWTASTDDVGVAGYQVLRDGVVVGSPTTTSFTDTGLAASTTYSYTVRAYDAAGNISVASTAVSATTGSGGGGDTTAPSAPSGVTVSSTTSSSVALSWSASTDNVGVTGYRVYRGSTLVGSPSSTSFTDTGLAASTTYSYTVKAIDAAGNLSAASTSVSATTQSGGGGSGSAVSVQYKNNDSSATDNQFKPGLRLVNNGSSAVDLSTVTVRYYFTKDSSSASPSYNCDYAVIGCGNVHATFGSVSPATATADTYLQLSFTGSLAAGASTGDIQNRINKSDWSNFDETNDYSYGTNTSYADTSTVTVYVNGTLVSGVEPGGGSGGDTQAPSVPSSVTVSGVTSSSVSLSWSASTDNVGVTSYQVLRDGVVVGSPASTSFTDTGLAASTAYTYTVRARDAAGNTSAASTAVTATTSGGSDTTAPSAPSGVTVSSTTSSSVALSWSASTDNVGVTGYRVYRDGTLVGSPSSTSFTDTGLAASTTYSYTVKAIDAAGNLSAASSAVTATTSGGGGGTITDCTTPDNTWNTTDLQGGEYIFQQNEWNSTAQQCATINPTTGAWSLSANFDGSTGNTPATYPSSYKGCHWGLCTTGSNMPIQVSKLSSVTSSWSTTQPGTGAYDVAYDIWFNSTPTTDGQPDGTEMMIWLNSNGSVQPFGSQTGTSTAAGKNWNVWTGNQASWKIITYVLNPGATSVTDLDIKALIDDAVSRGSLNSSHYLIDSEVGFEVWSGGNGLASNSYSFTATAGGGGDTTAPSAPSGVTVSSTTSSSVALSWSASTDNVGVTGYRVYRDGTLVGSPSSTSFTDTGLAASTTYSYTVKAIDAAGNLSAASSAVTATTGSGGGSGGCSATYDDSNDWGSGFTATVTVTNAGSAPISGWTVTWSFGGNQQITNYWSANLGQSGQSVSAANLGYNGALSPGGSTTFGFQAAYSGSNTAPTLTCTAN